MQVDELSLKLKVDQSQVGPELESFKGKVAGAFTKAEEHLEHMANGSRAFHRGLHALNEFVPMLGTTLSVAFNPLLLAIVGAGAAVQALRKHQEQAAESANKLAEAEVKLAEASVNRVLTLRDAAQKAKLAAAGKGGNASADDINAALEESRDEAEVRRRREALVGSEGNLTMALQGQKKTREKYSDWTMEGRAAQLEVDTARTTRDANQQLLTDAENAQLRHAKERGDAEAQHKRDLKDETEDLKEQEAIHNSIKEEGLAELEALRAKMTPMEKLRSLWRELDYIGDRIKDKDIDEVEQAKLKADYAKTNLEIEKQKHDIVREHDQKEAESKHAQSIGGMMEEQRFSEYQPTLHELAKSGWSTYNRVRHQSTFHQTPWAQQAGQIERMEGQAREMVLSGNVAGAKALVGKLGQAGSITDMKAQLEEAGLIKPEMNMQKMAEHMANLSAKAAGDGLNVNVKNAD